MIMSWVDFYKLPENTKSKFKAQCLHCLSQISGEMAISSNFIKHLKVKHREEYMAVSVAPGSPKRIGPKPPTTITNYATCSTSTEYGENHPKQIQAVDSLIQYIAGDLLPLSTVSSENFQKFVKCLDAKFFIPKRRKLTSRLIKEKAENVRKAMSDEIHAANVICFTIDLWSNRQMKAFLGITGHYIYNWELKSKMIGCNRFFGRHTGENIRNEFDEYPYPILSTLAAKYLTIPCTSTPVERPFSIAGKIFRPDRSRMSDLTFKNLMMIKCNASN